MKRFVFGGRWIVYAASIGKARGTLAKNGLPYNDPFVMESLADARVSLVEGGRK